MTSQPAATDDVDVLAVDRLARHLAAGARRWLLAPQEQLATSSDLAAALDDAAGDPDRTTALVGDDGVATLRSSCTPEDVVVVVAPAAAARDTCLRLTAWGPTSVLLPLGDTRPQDGLADLVLPPAADAEAARRRLTAIGRLLATREVTAGPPPSGERGEVCITCADEAVVAEVEALQGPTAVRARTPDGSVTVDTTLVDPPAVHDLLLVHARTAIALLDPTTHTARRGLDEA